MFHAIQFTIMLIQVSYWWLGRLLLLSCYLSASYQPITCLQPSTKPHTTSFNTNCVKANWVKASTKESMLLHLLMFIAISCTTGATVVPATITFHFRMRYHYAKFGSLHFLV
jgi:hypothetical protein